MAARARGFTLIEVAIVFIVIGLLVGAAMKGQELITAARVREIIKQQEEYKTAYLGFVQRFAYPPGDYPRATADIKGVAATGPCGNPEANGNGDGNNRIDAAGSEHTLVWEHLSRAGFLTIPYTCALTPSRSSSPVNRAEQPLEMITDANYAGTAKARHNIKTGLRVTPNLLAEADRKVDDGVATTGEFRGALNAAVTPADCYTAEGVWVDSSLNNCMAASLF